MCQWIEGCQVDLLDRIQVVKRHEREVKALQAENEELRERNKEIRDRLAKLEELVGRVAGNEVRQAVDLP